MRKVCLSYSLRKGDTQAKLYERHTFEDSGVAGKVEKFLEDILLYGVSSESVCIYQFESETIFEVNVEWTMSREMNMIECADFFCTVKGQDLRIKDREYNIDVQRKGLHKGCVLSGRICIIDEFMGSEVVFKTSGNPTIEDPISRTRRAIARSNALRTMFNGELIILDYV
jgi:hypothetical protein